MNTITFASWNIHNANPEAINRCLILLSNEYYPDVIGLFEVSGKEAIQAASKHFPCHSWTSIDNEILIGVSNEYFSFVSIRNEFKSQKQTLRPGVLVTLSVDGKKEAEYISFLFLHLKAFAQPLDYGLRQDMYSNLSSLKRSLPKDHKTVFLGDFNNVGMLHTYNERLDTTIEQELETLDRRMKAVDMQRYTSQPTWWNGDKDALPAAIDQVYASTSVGILNISILDWNSNYNNIPALDFIRQYSDHALITGEIKI